MKHPILVLFFLFVCGRVYAAKELDVASFIGEADKVTLFSLYPQQVYVKDEHGNPTDEERKKEHLHGYPVFGKIVMTEKSGQKEIREALLAALGSVERGPPLLCFEPRHAVCLRQGDRHVDLIICFECGKMEAQYFDINEKELRKHNVFFSIGSAGRETLNRLLDAQKIERDVPKKQEAERAKQ